MFQRLAGLYHVVSNRISYLEIFLRVLTISVALDLNDHLLQAPDSLLTALLRNLLRQVLPSLLGILLAADLLRRSDRSTILRAIISSLGERGRGNTVLTLRYM